MKGEFFIRSDQVSISYERKNASLKFLLNLKLISDDKQGISIEDQKCFTWALVLQNTNHA